ncbi:Nucleolar complex-like protein 2 [Lamellibrachia satsuma]|nr:Nucleolar complex-like protein 2 [Lamellibrachia satsuma]
MAGKKRKSLGSMTATELMADSLDSSSDEDNGAASTKRVTKKPKSAVKSQKQKKPLELMSVEEFMSAGLESSSDEDDASNSGKASTKSQAPSKSKQKVTAVSTMCCRSKQKVTAVSTMCCRSQQKVTAVSTMFCRSKQKVKAVSTMCYRSKQKVTAVSTMCCRSKQKVTAVSTMCCRSKQKVTAVSTMYCRSKQKVTAVSTICYRSKQKVTAVSTMCCRSKQKVTAVSTMCCRSKQKVTAVSTMKSSMSRLQQQDPEFYEFLRKEDKELLDFDASDDDEDASDDDDGTHKLPAKLAVASDESETEEEEEREEEVKEQKKTKREPRVSVTMKLVKKWCELLREKSSLGAIHSSVSAFKAAVQETSTESVEHGKYRVEGSQVFNAVVRLCITELLPAVNRLLKLPEQNSSQKKPVQPSSSKMWTKVRIDLKAYLQDLMQLMSQLAEPTVLNVILRHIHQMVPFYVCFPRLTQLLLKKVIGLWSAATEETTRVLAFLCVSRLLHVTQNRILETCIKQMYMAYVRNCKFTSPAMLPMINFMQRSMVEVFALDTTLTYQYAFIYIRQLAIHLRSAITVRKPEVQQTVYNWQYMHSLHLWVRMLSQLHPNPTLEPLIYPLTQVIIGAIKLISSARYYPLRFHCIKALNILSRATNTFVPVLPFLTEVFEVTDFNKKHKKMSLKPISFACILKLSKPQLEEKGFKDAVIDQLYEHLMDSFEIHSHTIGFPELALPALLQMKKFVKNCKVANYTKQIKQIVDKVTETSKVITLRRKTASLDLANTKAVVRCVCGKDAVFQDVMCGKDAVFQDVMCGKDAVFQDVMWGKDAVFQDVMCGKDAVFQDVMCGKDAVFQDVMCGKDAVFQDVMWGKDAVF